MMLRVLLLCSLAIPSTFTPDRPDTVADKMSEAVRLHDAAQTVGEEIVVLELLRKTSEEHPDEWLPNYWTAYLCTQVARLKAMVDDYPEDVDPVELIHEALGRYEDARAAKGKMTSVEKSDFHALRGFICDFEVMFTNPPADEIAALRDSEFKAAIRENPENPLMFTLIASDTTRTAATYGELLGAIALFDRAAAIFATAEDRGATTYWAKDFVPFWRGIASDKLEGALQ